MATPEPKPAGAIIDERYEVVHFLGNGSFGEVYETVDRFQDVTVALKLLQRYPSHNPWQEAQHLTALRSEYILPVLNADHFGGILYIVTKLATNGSAADRMEPCGVPPETAIRWIRSACRGAGRTHDARLLHRDIKAENLFIDERDNALLGDFGIAELMTGAGLASWGGSYETMAPEVAAGGATSIASDVYSLGATLYALLSGEYGHNDVDPDALRAKVVNGPPPILRDAAPHVARALAQRVSKAMSRNASDRFTSPTAFDAALGTLPPTECFWARTDEHSRAGHERCWRGRRTGRTDVTVCAVPAGRRIAVLAKHDPSGNSIHAACQPAAPRSALSRNLRAAFAAVT